MLAVRRVWPLAVLIATGVILSLASSADATFRLRVEDVGAGKGTVLTDTLNTGTVSFNGVVGAFVVNVTTGTANPPLVGVQAGSLSAIDLNTVNVTGNTGGTLRITLERDGFTPGAPGAVSFTAHMGGTISAAGSGTLQSYLNPGNLVPALGADQAVGAIGAIGALPAGSTLAYSTGAALTSPSYSHNSDFVGGVTLPNATYSQFTQVTITFTAPGSVSFNADQEVNTIPGPGGFVLTLTGLAVVGLTCWRRRLKLSQAAA